jgi:hypothetical protein
MATSTYSDLITQAAQELNLVARGEGIADPTMSQFLLDRLTAMVDSWNLKPTVIPWYQQHIFNLVPGQQSYLIGNGAPDWDAPRPIRLDPNATNLLLLSSIPPVRVPLTVLSVQQWANIALPQLQISFPQAIYLDRSVITPTAFTNVTVNTAGGPFSLPGGATIVTVNGNRAIPPDYYYASRIWVWGVPTTINQIELFYWQALTVGDLDDDVNAAPGYFRAMFLNLALEVASSFGVTPVALTVANARDALGDIKELNSPDMSMRPDPGMPTFPGGRYISKAQFLSGVF